MNMGKTLEGLHPFVKAKTEQLIANVNGSNGRLKKWKMIITQALRTKAEQDALYAQGRTKPGHKVTNAPGGYSMHNYGLAVDFALVSPDGRQVVWDDHTDFDGDKKADWMEVVEEAKKLGFTWGGDFKSILDKPHLQMTAGLSDRQVYTGSKPKFPTVTSVIPRLVEGVLWDDSLMKKGQVGRLTTLKAINLWERVGDELKKISVLEPGRTYRVYSYDSDHGGQFNVGSGQWITDMEGYVKYETPSVKKLEELKKFYGGK